MAKRFHDTDLKSKDWWIDLTQDQKCLLQWITMEHSSAGIWDINLSTPRKIYPFNSKIDIDEFIASCNSDGKTRMMKVANGKKLFFIPTIGFQYQGKNPVCHLNPKIPAIQGVLAQLNQYDETADWLAEQISEGKIVIGANKDVSNGALRKRVSSKTKLKIHVEDDFQCQYCGFKGDEFSLTIDHILAIENGGDNSNDNLISACHTCNKRKKDQNVFQFMEMNGIAPLPTLKKKLSTLDSALITLNKKLSYPLVTHKDKDKDKDKETIVVTNNSSRIKKKNTKEKDSLVAQRNLLITTQGRKRLADNVYLTTGEHEELLKICGDKIAQRSIQKLDTYVKTSGKVYLDDFAAMESWVIGAVKKEMRPNGNTERLYSYQEVVEMVANGKKSMEDFELTDSVDKSGKKLRRLKK